MPKKGGNSHKSDTQDGMFGLGGARLLHGEHLLCFTALIAQGLKNCGVVHTLYHLQMLVEEISRYISPRKLECNRDTLAGCFHYHK